MSVNIAIPHHPQLDNRHSPYGACNVTSYAMVGAWLNIKPQNPKEQLEDEFWRWMVNRGLNPEVHSDLITLARHYGIKARFTTSATWEEVRSHLDTNRPVIVAGHTTQSGHIFVIRGYDETGYFVNDPYGEWFSTGYRTDLSGENLHYSQRLMNRHVGVNGDLWCHFIDSTN
ncbi:C39 family peptidase [Oscillatoria laete-virens NRMC-F 0139]|nr:C39 family peptidase [Oscillatoria laete-virens]MDL5053754.1 C39 family peptidase [Oscillatoria laete-virens NRMC-F 0139]